MGKSNLAIPDDDWHDINECLVRYSEELIADAERDRAYGHRAFELAGSEVAR